MRLSKVRVAPETLVTDTDPGAAAQVEANDLAKSIGQAPLTLKPKLRLRSVEAQPLVARVVMTLQTTALELELAIAGPKLDSAERGKLRARLKACLADLALTVPGQLPPQDLLRLAQACESLAARKDGSSDDLGPLLLELTQRARIQVLGAQGLRRSGSSVLESHAMWREAYRQDPVGTLQRIRKAFQLETEDEALKPLLAKLLGRSCGLRAFVKTTRAWMRDPEKAEQERVRGPRPTQQITAAEDVPTMVRSADGKVKNVVVVGQGPIGLLSAVLMKSDRANAEAQIYLVDKRGEGGKMSYTRPIKLAVRHGFLSLLDAAHGPKEHPSVLDLLKERGQVHFLDSEAPKNQIRGEISRKRATRQPLGLIAETSIALVETRHLEQALRDIASSIPGLHFLNGYEPELHADGKIGLDGQPTFALSLQRAGKDAEGHWGKLGAPVELGTPDLILAADGATSHTVKDAGIGLRVGSPLGRYVAGTVTVPSGPNLHQTYTISRPSGEPVKVYANTVGAIQESWMIAQIPSDWSEAEARDSIKVSQYYREVCGQALGQDPAQLEVTWGGSSAFTLRPSMTTEPGRGNVIPVGDASGNNTFLVGAGTVGGAQEALIVAEMAARMNRSDSVGEAERALRIGTRDTYRAAAAWHQRGPASAQTELNISELIHQNVTQPGSQRGFSWMGSV
ncbi:MAG: hypothetical protein U1E65_31035 [Myxococcota bacterium]